MMVTNSNRLSKYNHLRRLTLFTGREHTVKAVFCLLVGYPAAVMRVSGCKVDNQEA